MVAITNDGRLQSMAICYESKILTRRCVVKKRMLAAFIVSTALLIAQSAQWAAAQGLMSRPVKIIVPYPAGGIVDLMARAVSDRLAEKLGVPVVVESKPGANTSIGTEAVARAEPDGRTILMATSGLVITPHLQKVTWDPIKDFVGVAYMGQIASVAAVHPSIPARDISSFIAAAKSKPDTINYIAPGTSSSFTLSVVLLEQMNGIRLVPVAYRGVPQAISDLLEGRVHFGFLPAPLVTQFIVEGKLNALAVTGSRRLKELPQVPTMAEQGYNISQVISWYTFAVPANTPKSEVEKLNLVLNEILSEPETIARIEGIGGTPISGWTPAEVSKLYAEEFIRWGNVISKAGIKPN
jgi:tripartite-type tricarboxylate transporter receptor subunit TctC